MYLYLECENKEEYEDIKETLKARGFSNLKCNEDYEEIKVKISSLDFAYNSIAITYNSKWCDIYLEQLHAFTIKEY